jgi:glycosyltransferase involved in cell wall biosynthesis
MSDPIRVLHVIDQLAGGGAEVSLMEYLTEAGRDPRIEHAVVALNGSPETVVAADTLPMEVIIGPLGRRPRPADVSLVRTALTGFRPDLLHCTLVRSTFASSAALRGTDLPMMVSLTSVHYDVEDTTGTLKQRVGLRVSHTIHGSLLRRDRVRFHAVSQPVADKAVEVFGLDPDRISVVPRGRPDPLSRLTDTREAVRQREGIPDDAPVIINVAREHLIKNHAALLESVASIREEVPGLRVVFVGGISTGSGVIDQLVRDKGLAEVVVRLGHRADVPDLLRASDLFVSTSISEGLPGAIVEAMGMSLPVIAFDVPGVNDVMTKGHPGLVPFGDTTALSDRILKVLTDAALRDELGAASRRRFEEAFEIGGYVRRIGDLYESLLSERRLVSDRAELG